VSQDSEDPVKTFQVDDPPPGGPSQQPTASVAPAAALRGLRSGSVRVAEITAEHAVADPPELPLHLAGEPGTVALQLRTTIRRVAIGAGLARNADLLSAVRSLPGLPGLVTSPAGGTFIVGGPGWLGLCAVGVPPRERGMPLDWMSDSLAGWFRTALADFAVEASMGRVDGGWCPGFSDIAAGGRKLVGLGYRVTRDWVVMRGVMPVAPIAAEDMDLLIACHRLIGVEVLPEANTSLSEAAGRPELAVPEVIERWRDLATPAG